MGTQGLTRMFQKKAECVRACAPLSDPSDEEQVEAFMKFGDSEDQGKIAAPDLRPRQPYMENNLVPQTLQRNLQISYQGNRNQQAGNPARSGSIPMANLPRG